VRAGEVTASPVGGTAAGRRPPSPPEPPRPVQQPAERRVAQVPKGETARSRQVLISGGGD